MVTERIELQSTEPIVSTPPLEMPRDARGRIRWSILKQDPTKLATVIEAEARNALASGIHPTPKSLIRAGLSYLSFAIQRYYPDSFTGLRQALDLPTVKRPNNYWTGTEMMEKMREEARLVYQQEGSISVRILKRTNKSDFNSAIIRHYPGGLKQLKIDLGLSKDLATVSKKRRPQGYWTLDTIRKEAEEFLIQHGDLTVTLMHREGRNDLEATLRKSYPGGLKALKRELGVGTQIKPRGYWSAESVVTEALQFYAQFGVLTPSSLIKHGRGDLLGAIFTKYPGGISQLKKDQGIEITRKQTGYWTPETTREEALAFYRQHGGLTYTLFEQTKRYDFINAVNRYPGKIRQLQQDLGIESNKKPYGYWTPENIEFEAAKFFRKHGELTHASLRGHKQRNLSHKIGKKYPGGMAALLEKLGINSQQEDSIPPAEANEQLLSLLEG